MSRKRIVDSSLVKKNSLPVSLSLGDCSGGDRADEWLVPAEAEGAAHGRVQGGGVEQAAGDTTQRQTGRSR